MAYFKIEDSAVLTQVHAFFELREKYLHEIHEFKKDMGFEACVTTDNLYFGISLDELGLSSHQYETGEYDKTTWCRKHRGKYNRFVAMKPFSRHTAILKKWNAFFEKQPFSYVPLTELLFNENICILTKTSPKIYYAKGHCLLVEMPDYKDEKDRYTFKADSEPVQIDQPSQFFGDVESTDKKNHIKVTVIS